MKEGGYSFNKPKTDQGTIGPQDEISNFRIDISISYLEDPALAGHLGDPYSIDVASLRMPTRKPCEGSEHEEGNT